MQAPFQNIRLFLYKNLESLERNECISLKRISVHLEHSSCFFKRSHPAKVSDEIKWFAAPILTTIDGQMNVYLCTNDLFQIKDVQGPSPRAQKVYGQEGIYDDNNVII